MATHNKKNRIPKIATEPKPTKTAKIGSPAPVFQGGVMAWRFAGIDKNGPYAWTNLVDPIAHKEIIDKFSDFENMNEAALKQAGCHFIPIEKLCKDAQKRLVDIKLDDLDSLFSLRLSGETRVFCVHRPKYMRVLWYDPKHKVCPSKKKNT